MTIVLTSINKKKKKLARKLVTSKYRAQSKWKGERKWAKKKEKKNILNAWSAKKKKKKKRPKNNLYVFVVENFIAHEYKRIAVSFVYSFADCLESWANISPRTSVCDKYQKIIKSARLIFRSCSLSSRGYICAAKMLVMCMLFSARFVSSFRRPVLGHVLAPRTVIAIVNATNGAICVPSGPGSALGLIMRPLFGAELSDKARDGR